MTAPLRGPEPPADAALADSSQLPGHATALADVLNALGVRPEAGLSVDEAARRLDNYGPNALERERQVGVVALVAGQLRSPLVLVLLVAAALSLLVGDARDALVILLVVILNGAIGVTQEARAGRALAALQAMSAPVADALRAGAVQRISASALVPGDIVEIRAGDIVPADGRLLAGSVLQIDESTLTGESQPIDKDPDFIAPPETDLPERLNMVYSGTSVALGSGRLVVTATGRRTELGIVANVMRSARRQPTPLERQIAWLGRVLTAVAIGATAAVFLLGMLRGEALLEMFLVGLSLAVAAVPEGLPAVVTIVLALGVQRMARRNAIVRRLASVEALGAATVICSDKTGTLTLGDMRAVEVLVGGQRIVVGPERSQPGARIGIAPAFIRAMALARSGGAAGLAAESPTERAMLELAQRSGIEPRALEESWATVLEIPFSSSRRRMTSVRRGEAGLFAFSKGAPEAIIRRCDRLIRGETEIALTDSGREELLIAVNELAERGLRVLAVAQRSLSEAQLQAGRADGDLIERELTLLGMVALADPPRPEVPAAIKACQAAGIRVVMITGDHPATALGIAGGLEIGDERVATGAQLQRAQPAELDLLVRQTSVYARVAPVEKVAIVQALQRQGHVVAMTGDGANDGPALRLADIGVAMGVRGTAVAREAADIVLADDNFASIVAAVVEGRIIYSNLRKTVLYLISGNLGEILVVLIAMLAGLPLPLQAAQILWINMITDSLPALALGFDTPDADVLASPPRRAGERFLPGWSVPLICVPSVLLALVSLLAFLVALNRQPDDLQSAQSAAFVTLVMAHLGLAWALRSTRGTSLRRHPFSNRTLLLATGVGVGLLPLLLYWPPAQMLLRSSPLDLTAWLLAIALSPLPWIGAELTKLRLRRGPPELAVGAAR